jgi:hypothetical protein
VGDPKRRPIIIVGAAGVFGQRLVQQLLACGEKNIVLSGRSAEKLAALGLPQLEVFLLDRNSPSIAHLKKFAGGVVVDVAGPFQNSSLVLPEACIEAGLNYMDIADAREFVARFVTLNEKAEAAGVFVITGASSTPALSHAVLDQMTKGWRDIHSIFVGISPGNRAPRGLSVIRAILSYVGKPFSAYVDGVWRRVFGWADEEKKFIDGVGFRRFVHCEVPDQDLLVARFRPKATAVFKAGLELGIMQQGLRFIGLLVQFGLIKDLPRWADIMQWLANVLYPFGTDKGGMLVEATGDRCVARWSLAAGQGLGPNVPILPALALLLRRNDLAAGARTAAGLVNLQELETHFRRIGLSTTFDYKTSEQKDIFQAALGEEVWNALPSINRRIHQCQPGVVLKGEAEVSGAESWLGKAVARVFGFPPTGKVPATVVIESDGTRELWRRRFGLHAMNSVMRLSPKHAGSVEESFGPFRFRLRLDAGTHGLTMVLTGMRFGPLPLPLLFAPEVVASERASQDGRHMFDVKLSKWPMGLLVHYKGYFQVV